MCYIYRQPYCSPPLSPAVASWISTYYHRQRHAPAQTHAHTHTHIYTCRHTALSLRRSGCKMISSFRAFCTCFPGQFPHSWLPQPVWPLPSSPLSLLLPPSLLPLSLTLPSPPHLLPGPAVWTAVAKLAARLVENIRHTWTLLILLGLHWLAGCLFPNPMNTFDTPLLKSLHSIKHQDLTHWKRYINLWDIFVNSGETWKNIMWHKLTLLCCLVSKIIPLSYSSPIHIDFLAFLWRSCLHEHKRLQSCCLIMLTPQSPLHEQA